MFNFTLNLCKYAYFSQITAKIRMFQTQSPTGADSLCRAQNCGCISPAPPDKSGSRA